MDREKKEHKVPKVLKIIGMVILGLCAAVIFALAFGYFVQLLWNWLMPNIFHLQKIDFWQAFGLVLLTRLLFGHFGIDHDDKHDRNHHHRKHRAHFEKHWEWGKDECAKGDWKDWTYYDDWWKHEGKEAFERYIEEKKSETGSNSE